MEYIYASLLLHSAKKEISEDSLKKVLSAAGLEADDVKVKMVVAALKEVNIDEVLRTAAVTPMAVTPATAPAAQPQPVVESKEVEGKKEEKKEVSEEELSEGLSSLFG